MKTETLVVACNLIEGFHRWPNASPRRRFLAALHRHIFRIETSFAVADDDREIEIFDAQERVEEFLTRKFGRPCRFGDLSCEAIARTILEETGAVRVEVREDGFGGAVVSRRSEDGGGEC